MQLPGGSSRASLGCRRGSRRASGASVAAAADAIRTGRRYNRGAAVNGQHHDRQLRRIDFCAASRAAKPGPGADARRYDVPRGVGHFLSGIADGVSDRIYRFTDTAFEFSPGLLSFAFGLIDFTFGV